MVRIESFSVSPLSVPLLEPFVIASAQVTTTRAALVRIIAVDGDARVQGMGEAAALFPVTHEDQPELLQILSALPARFIGSQLPEFDAVDRMLAECVESHVARAAVEMAILDVIGQCRAQPVSRLLGGALEPQTVLTTDITIPIGTPEHMTELAVQHRAAGFRFFKIKVGRSLDDDVRALEAIARRVPDARFRVDANGGYSAKEARAFLGACRNLALDCFEQPCAREDEGGMAEITSISSVPVVADESCRNMHDLERIVDRRLAHGINLKLAKTGSMVRAKALGDAAKHARLSVMCGAMVETRLGLCAMAHVAAALGGVDWIDLDTDLLLASDPFEGGYTSLGEKMTLGCSPGLGVTERHRT